MAKNHYPEKGGRTHARPGKCFQVPGKPNHGKHGPKTRKRPPADLDSDECPFCGEEECECHDIVTGFPGGCSKD